MVERFLNCVTSMTARYGNWRHPMSLLICMLEDQTGVLSPENLRLARAVCALGQSRSHEYIWPHESWEPSKWFTATQLR